MKVEQPQARICFPCMSFLHGIVAIEWFACHITKIFAIYSNQYSNDLVLPGKTDTETLSRLVATVFIDAWTITIVRF